MLAPPDPIAQAREAWSRIRTSGRRNFEDWICIGRGLQIGRSAALQAAATNRCVGSRYNREMGTWLRQAGLDGIVAQERYRAILIVENLPAIEAFRAGLDETRRRHLNHPNATWHAWRRATRTTAAVAPRHVAAAAERTAAAARSAGGGYHKAVAFDQDMVRRAALALKQNWSGDTHKMAIVALRAAIRDQDDIAALIPDRQPQRQAQVPALAMA